MLELITYTDLDRQLVIDLLIQASHDEIIPSMVDLPAAMDSARAEAFLEEQGELWFVQHDSELVGYVDTIPADYPDFDVPANATELRIGLFESGRGRGIGRTIVTKAFQELSSSYDHVVWTYYSSNRGSAKLIESFNALHLGQETNDHEVHGPRTVEIFVLDLAPFRQN